MTTGVHLGAGRPLAPQLAASQGRTFGYALAVAGSGGVAHQLPEHAVALAA